MRNTVVVGAQWGDEAKGKMVDYLAQNVGMVVRYGGGSNAGHTVIVAGEQFKFHLIPCGILNRTSICVIADGVVVDPAVLVSEIDELEARGYSAANLRISASAHVVMPYHLLLDALNEKRKGDQALGTTGRGIGPVYADRAERTGIRMGDLVDSARFELRLREQVQAKNLLLTRIYEVEPLDADAILSSFQGYADRLRPYVCDTGTIVAAASAAGTGIVFEGAQGTLLDLDMGTYPFVTSSHPIAGGACLGTGVGPTAIHAVLGVAKSYTTRVGAGVFPTELLNGTGDYIRQKGHEYGTTTGRPRRCGWLDAVILRFAARVNGLTGLCLGMLDVLGGIDTLRIGVGYRNGDSTVTELPMDLTNCTSIEPIYEDLPGWTQDISGATSLEQLPKNCIAYIRRVEQLVGVPVVSLSVGPDRAQTIRIADDL